MLRPHAQRVQRHQPLRGVVGASFGRVGIDGPGDVVKGAVRALPRRERRNSIVFSWCGKRQPKVLWIVQAYVTAAKSLYAQSDMPR
jgi:hypothetical protein